MFFVVTGKCATCRKRIEALNDTGVTASTSKETITKASTSKSTPASKNASSSTASSSKGKANNSTSFPFGQSTSKSSNSNQIPDSVSSLSEINSDVDSLSSLSEDEDEAEAEPQEVDTKNKKKKGGRISVVKAKDGGASDTSTSTVDSKTKLKLAVDKLNGIASTSNASTPAPETNTNGGVAAPRRPMPPRGPKPISAPLATPIFIPSSPSRPGLPTAAILSAMHIREYVLRFSKFMPSLSPLPQAKVSKKKKQARNTRGNQSKNNSRSKPEPGVLSYHAAKARETGRLSILSGLENFETFWSKDSDLSQRAILQGLFELVVGPPMAYHERDILSTYDTLALFRNCHKALHEAGPNATSVELTNKPWRLLDEFLELEGWSWELEPELAVLEEFGLTEEEESRGKNTRRGTVEVGTVQRMRMILAFIQGSYAATLMKKDVIDVNSILLLLLSPRVLLIVTLFYYRESKLKDLNEQN